MFDVAPTELLLVAVVALVVIGPKDLPRAMRFVGNWIAKARGVARHFRSGMDEMIRQAELEEMEKKWAAENARIMAEHPPQPTTIEGEMIPLGGMPASADAPTIADTPASVGSLDPSTGGHDVPADSPPSKPVAPPAP